MAGKSKRNSERELKPKLRFPEFDSEWTEEPLSESAEIINEKAGEKKCIFLSITSGVGLVSQQEKFGRTIAGKSYKNYYLIRRNDFAYNKSATKEYPQGYIAMYSGDEVASVPNSIFTCFRVDEEVLVPEYVDYLFHSNHHGRWLQKFITVGARAHGSLSVNDDDLLAMPVPRPSGKTSLAEQTKIAGCLSSLDELIGAESRKLETLQAHKKGLMQQLFPREGETLPHLRFPEFKHAPEWEARRLDEVGRVIRGSSPRPKGDPRYYGGPVPRLMVQDVTRDGKWVTPCIDSLTLEGAELSRPCPAGTLTIVCSGAIGVVSFLAVDACIHDGFLALVDVDETIATKDFLFHVLGTLGEQFQKGATHGGVFTNLTTAGIKEFEVSCPNVDEQSRIVEFLNSLDDLIHGQTQRLDELGAHKKGLMQQLFPSLEDAHA